MTDEPKIIRIGNILPSYSQVGYVLGVGGIAPTIMDNHGYPGFIIERTECNMEQMPFNTAERGAAYTITTRYGAMCESNLRGGNFPMTAILEIENPSEDMKKQIDNGELNFESGMPMTCAVRGRGDGEVYSQQLEMGEDVANTLTSVQKDSMVAEGVSDPSIISMIPWCRPGGDKGGISPAVTTSSWEHNNFVRLPGEKSMVMSDPRKNYGRIEPSSESSPTLLSSDYKSPHLVMESALEVARTAERLRMVASASRGTELGITINPDLSLRPHKLNKAKDGVSEYYTDYDGGVGSTTISARPNNVYGKTTRYRIRKLTPRECYRLMDVDEPYINRLINSGIAKSNHYKLAGNSIVVSCLYHIFKNLFTNAVPENSQLSLF